MPSVFDTPRQGKPGVQKTRELLRILGLPRRVLDLDNAPLDLSPLYLKNGERCDVYPKCPICLGGAPKLWPTQSIALLEAEGAWGLFAPLGVGAGKTLLTLLLADVLQSNKTVLLVPAQLKKQLLTRDMPSYSRHFHLPLAKITVVSYSELSIAKSANVLEELQPDLIVADECHALSGNSARTKRFMRYFRAHPQTRFCALSGTVTKRSLRDYAHLCELALRSRSPVPNNWSDVQEWSEALDPIAEGRPPGALRVFAEGDLRLESGDTDMIRVAVREGYRRRLTESPGVVATAESWQGASLVIEAIENLPLPKTVRDALTKLHETWAIGDDELESAMRVSEVAKQLAVGFYYQWQWPDGAKDFEWLKARATWHKAVREILKRSRPGMDSPMLVARAVVRGQLPELREPYDAWRAVSDRYKPTPPVEAIWLDDFAIKAAIAWTERNTPSIVWYSRRAVGEALAAHMPVYGAGTDAGTADPDKQPIIACGIASQGTGKNLQRFAKALVIEPPAGGATWEQLLGRLHRPGQTADDVKFDVFAHTGELMGALYRAVSDAQYVEQTQGQKQKILKVQRIGW